MWHVEEKVIMKSSILYCFDARQDDFHVNLFKKITYWGKDCEFLRNSDHDKSSQLINIYA